MQFRCENLTADGATGRQSLDGSGALNMALIWLNVFGKDIYQRAPAVWDSSVVRASTNTTDSTFLRTSNTTVNLLGEAKYRRNENNLGSRPHRRRDCVCSLDMARSVGRYDRPGADLCENC